MDNNLKYKDVDEKKLFEFINTKANDYGRFILYYQSAIMEIETKFKVLSNEFMLANDRNPISSIHSRIKKPAEIMKKLERKGIAPTLEGIEKNLNDIAGIRVVCSFADDVYMIANALLAQDDVVLIEKKDYIKNPKKNGYRSLHLIVEIPIFLTNTKKNVRVEVQLRTIAMDCWATLEHQMNYKKGNEINEAAEAELSFCAELSARLDEKMNELRKKLIKE